MVIRVLWTGVVVGCLVAPVRGHGGQIPKPVVAPAAAAAIIPPRGATASTVGAATKGGASRSVVTGAAGCDGWRAWWRLDQDRLLDLKRRMDAGALASSGARAGLAGQGRRLPAAGLGRPGPAEVRAVVVPALLDILAESDDPEVLDSCLVALGRVTTESVAGPVFEAVVPFLEHRVDRVRNAAALSLGILGAPEAGAHLASLVFDDSAGRRLVGGGAVPTWTRAHAAVALGLLGGDEAALALLRAARDLPDSLREVKACVLVGLGVSEPGPVGRDEALALLLTLLEDRRLDQDLKSLVPTALSRLGCRSAVPVLVDLVGSSSRDAVVCQSACMALGRMGRADDGVAKVLEKALDSQRNTAVRRHAMLAWAQVVGRSGTPEQHDRLARRLALECMGRGRQRMDRPWGALAVARLVRKVPALQTRLGAVVREAYDDESDPMVRGAFAVAAGLMGDGLLVPALLDDFRATRDQVLRGDLALALGMLQAHEAREDMSRVLADPTALPALHLAVATAFGAMGDTAGVQALLSALESAESFALLNSLARALGRVGDRRTVGPLLDMAMREDLTPASRGYAVVALGLVCEKTDLPWNAVLKEGHNPCAPFPALSELLAIL